MWIMGAGIDSSCPPCNPELDKMDGGWKMWTLLFYFILEKDNKVKMKNKLHP